MEVRGDSEGKLLLLLLRLMGVYDKNVWVVCYVIIFFKMSFSYIMLPLRQSLFLAFGFGNVSTLSTIYN